MKRLIIVLFGFLVIFVLGACIASKATSEIPIADPVASELLYNRSYEDCNPGESSSSVQGNWALCNPFTDPITIINTSNQTWNFSYRSHYGREVPAPCTRLIHLTNDDNYLYFSLDADCSMADPGFIFSIALFRMDLSNGKVSEILKAAHDFAADAGNTYSVSISPTGSQMTYIEHQKSPLVLTLLDLQTGKIRSFPLDAKYIHGGNYAWSEDGTELVFMVETEKASDSSLSMIFIDLIKDEPMVTFIKDKDRLWMSSRLEITDDGIAVIPIDGEPLFYDIETGILSPANQ